MHIQLFLHTFFDKGRPVASVYRKSAAFQQCPHYTTYTHNTLTYSYKINSAKVRLICNSYTMAARDFADSKIPSSLSISDIYHSHVLT